MWTNLPRQAVSHEAAKRPSYPYITPSLVRRHKKFDCSDIERFNWARWPVPTLMPKPGSATAMQENVPGRKSDALRALGLPRVMLDHKIYSLKIRVSVVRLTRIDSGRFSPYGQLRCLDSLCESIPPWPPIPPRKARRIQLGTE